MTPEESVGVQLLTVTGPEKFEQKNHCNKNVNFHLFLADENHGAILKPLEKCNTMSSFFDEALSAWGTLEMTQQQPRMIAVKVSIENVRRPIVVMERCGRF